MSTSNETGQEALAAFESGADHEGGRAGSAYQDPSLNVLLTAEPADKLKRAVKLPFVDFTTLAQRRAACEAELEVNCRFAAGFYINVLPVTLVSRGAAQQSCGRSISDTP